MFAEILIEYSSEKLDKVFTYIVPSNLHQKIKIGMKVQIPFNNRVIFGFVLNIKNNYEESYELKEVINIVDENIILNEELLKLGEYIQNEFLVTKIASYQTMFPSSLKIKNTKNKSYDKFDTYIKLNASGEEILKYFNNNRVSHQQKEIINSLRKEDLLKNTLSKSAIEKLIENNIVSEYKVQKYRINKNEITKNNLEMTTEQLNVFNSISFDAFNTYLLHGVTGSGKTFIYIKLIEKCLKQGKTAILLVPEITLSAQIAREFYNYFGSKVAIFHSALSEGEKYDEYLKIIKGEVFVVVGTRSAIFVPLKDIGIVIIDEEHSDNYKQDNYPRYDAISIAKKRGDYHKCPLILASATPRLESMARAFKNKYQLLSLNKRINNIMHPKISLVDMKIELKKRNKIISDELKNKIYEKLAKKEQVILLLNRRGFSTIITCSNCGYTYKCPSCDISLTYHKSNNTLRCHYCNYQIKKEDKCPECHENSLNYLGLGTEKLETEIANIFSQARIIRMDADTTSKKGSHEKIIEAFKNYEYDIMLGTQMISKGLDFPKVSLVGILNADQSLLNPDFRSNETTFDLLMQASGRAGRSGLESEVIIQTLDVDNEIFSFVKNNSYIDFYKYEMNNRKLLLYPPYTYLIGIKVIGENYEETSKNANKVVTYLNNKLKNIIVLGPTTANIFKFNNKFRFQIIIKYRECNNLMNVLKELVSIYSLDKKVSIEIDIDPKRF